MGLGWHKSINSHFWESEIWKGLHQAQIKGVKRIAETLGENSFPWFFQLLVTTCTPWLFDSSPTFEDSKCITQTSVSVITSLPLTSCLLFYLVGTFVTTVDVGPLPQINNSGYFTHFKLLNIITSAKSFCAIGWHSHKSQELEHGHLWRASLFYHTKTIISE